MVFLVLPPIVTTVKSELFFHERISLFQEGLTGCNCRNGGFPKIGKKKPLGMKAFGGIHEATVSRTGIPDPESSSITDCLCLPRVILSL